MMKVISTPHDGHSGLAEAVATLPFCLQRIVLHSHTLILPSRLVFTSSSYTVLSQGSPRAEATSLGVNPLPTICTALLMRSSARQRLTRSGPLSGICSSAAASSGLNQVTLLDAPP